MIDAAATVLLLLLLLHLLLCCCAAFVAVLLRLLCCFWLGTRIDLAQADLVKHMLYASFLTLTKVVIGASCQIAEAIFFLD